MIVQYDAVYGTYLILSHCSIYITNELASLPEEQVASYISL